jgi:hypothetical protein
MNRNHIYFYLISSIFGLLTWEHVGRTMIGTTLRPSVWFTFCTETAQQMFRSMGKFWAILSSFLVYLDLKEIKITLIDLVKPCVEFIASPLNFFSGFAAHAWTYLSDEGLVYVGAFILGCVLLWVGYKLISKYRPQWFNDTTYGSLSQKQEEVRWSPCGIR